MRRPPHVPPRKTQRHNSRANLNSAKLRNTLRQTSRGAVHLPTPLLASMHPRQRSSGASRETHSETHKPWAT
eukprot:6029237-Amphidinium_carterae.1